jgi:glycosyltransferase involved in cell wall biosynthesis
MALKQFLHVPLSVIVPTYNGAAKIGNLLLSLTQQTFQEFEVIVVVDGSNDNTIEVVETFREVLTIKVIHQSNSGRSGAKNRGAKEAKGPILVFYDDDMVPSTQSVESHFKFLKTKEGSILGGQAKDPTGDDKPDIQKYKAELSEKWIEGFPSSAVELTIGNCFLTAANSSMHKNVFESLAGFDERLTDAEDYDFAVRAIEKGFSVYFDKSNIALHNDPITCRKYIQRQRKYRAAHLKLMELHPGRHTNRPKTPGGFVQSIKKQYYYIFSFPIWIHLVDNTRIMLAIPKVLRYRIYSWIIQSMSVVYPNVEL